MSATFGTSGSRVAARLPHSNDTTPIGPTIRLSDFKDGQGNTVLFSESLYALPWHRSGFTNAEDLIFVQQPDEIIYPVLSRFTNAMVWQSIDYRVWQALMTPAGRDQVPTDGW
ncbi:DUF1559 family PulG-like putative transporter [Neorhodopirellula pilleata]|uniref:DUF1559 domain-containing protein n=1 Tax=Neorhodopirellula pilleata TaxID=2714738 RepID=A0A5C6AWJ8_9BACT|nr:hypothetical protein Pla100_07760 [Neorhodopirellula pilleata]